MLSAEELCDKIAIISKGVKMDEGKVKELKVKYSCNSLEEVFLKASMLSDRGAHFDQIIRNF